MMSDEQFSQGSERNPLLASEDSSSNISSNGQVTRDSSDVPKEDTAKFLHPGTMTIPGEEMRKTFEAGMSGVLALGLWLLLGGTVITHLAATVVFSSQLVEKPSVNDTEGQSERIEKATSTVGDTAKTLYALLTPLAATVTGYYFTAGKGSGSSDDSDAK
jgi:hypothetical protein